MALCYAWQPWETRRAHSIYPVPFLNILHICLRVFAPSKPSSVQRGVSISLEQGRGGKRGLLFSCMVMTLKGPGLSSLQNRLVCPGCLQRSSQPPMCLRDTQLLENRGSTGWRMEKKSGSSFRLPNDKSGETPSKLAEPAGLGAVCGAPQNNNRFHYEDQLPGDFLEQPQPLGCGAWAGWMEQDVCAWSHKPPSVTDAHTWQWPGATSLPHSLLGCSLLESPLSRIHLNPAYSSSPNNYCQTLACQIRPNSSHYSPCFMFHEEYSQLFFHVFMKEHLRHWMESTGQQGGHHLGGC